MRFSTVTLGLLSATSTALAGTVTIQNNAKEIVYLTETLSDQTSTSSTIAVNASYSEVAAGQGKSLGITLNPNYFSPSTPKLIFGYSVDTMSGLVYWTVSSVDGNPFSAPGDGFNVEPSDPTCTNATTYDGQVHTCGSAANFTLTVY